MSRGYFAVKSPTEARILRCLRVGDAGQSGRNSTQPTGGQFKTIINELEIFGDASKSKALPDMDDDYATN